MVSPVLVVAVVAGMRLAALALRLHYRHRTVVALATLRQLTGGPDARS
jgi:hypothetical protein